MIKLTEMPYNVAIPLHDEVYNMPALEPRKNYMHSEDGSWPDYQLRTVIVKTRDVNIDKYDIKLLRLPRGNRNPLVVGNMYFNYDPNKKESAFYGVIVKSSLRGKGISNYLISRWIEICLQNGVESLCTIDKQRKPILLYSLKKMSFELKDTSLYEQGHNIVICKDGISGKKVFYFENDLDEEIFSSSAINKETPHIIISKISDRYSVIDKVVLSEPYSALDLSVAEGISKVTIESFPDRIRNK